MNTVLAELIHSAQGYSHETAGVVIAFFNNPQQARLCADEMRTVLGKTVDVCGCRLSIS